MDREALVFLAKITEQAERYDEMLEHMKAIADASEDELSLEERNLLSVAYKNVLGARRASWRVVASIERRGLVGASASASASGSAAAHADRTRAYREKIEREILAICTEFLHIMDKQLALGAALSEESKVFLYKSKGDYYRYLTEVQTGETRDDSAARGLDMYLRASKLAVDEMPPTHPLRLGLALNFSVFYYETMHAPDRACNLAKRAFDDAIAELDSLSEETYRDSTLVMQLLRDNLTLWSSDEPEMDESVDAGHAK